MVLNIIAPVSQSSSRRKFYLEQIQRGIDGKQMMWDDGKGNPTQKEGGLFCFLHQVENATGGRRAEIHRITAVKNRSHKMPSWSDRERNVLFLSEQICVISWDTWKRLRIRKGGYERQTRPIRDQEISRRLTKYVEETIMKKKDEAKNAALNAARMATIAAKTVSDCGWSEGSKPLWAKMMEQMLKKDKQIQVLSKEIVTLKQQLHKQKESLTMIFGASKIYVDRNNDDDDDYYNSDEEEF